AARTVTRAALPPGIFRVRDFHPECYYLPGGSRMSTVSSGENAADWPEVEAAAPRSASTPHAADASQSEKRAYPAAAAMPTQRGEHGIQYDFNDGCRIALPEGAWHVRLRDLDTGNILYETDIGAGRVHSSKRYYLRCRIEVWKAGQSAEPLFRHDY